MPGPTELHDYCREYLQKCIPSRQKSLQKGDVASSTPQVLVEVTFCSSSSNQVSFSLSTSSCSQAIDAFLHNSSSKFSRLTFGREHETTQPIPPLVAKQRKSNTLNRILLHSVLSTKTYHGDA